MGDSDLVKPRLDIPKCLKPLVLHGGGVAKKTLLGAVANSAAQMILHL